MSDEAAPEFKVVIVKAPWFPGVGFWGQVFKFARETDAHVVVVHGGITINNATGAGATINRQPGEMP